MQAGIPQEQVETHREDAEDQDARRQADAERKDVGHDRRQRQHDRQHQKVHGIERAQSTARDFVVLHRCADGGQLTWGERVFGHSRQRSFIPNRPLGRTSRMRPMTRNVSTSAIAGTRMVRKVTAMPMSSPPQNAPVRLPMPPTTTTINALMRTCASRPGNRLSTGPATTPPNAASAAPNAKTPVNIAPMFTPRPAAICRSATPARMIAPMRVRRSVSHRPRAISRPMTMTNRRYTGYVLPRMSMGPAKTSGGGRTSSLLPQMIFTSSAAMNDNPNVRMTWSSSGRRYRRFSSAISISTPRTPTAIGAMSRASQKLWLARLAE